MTSLIELDENIWVAESSFKMIGIECGNRMTIIRLNNGDLFLHSPLAFKQSLNDAIRELGNIRYLIAPNLAHNLFIADWKQANPSASLLAPKRIKKATPDFKMEKLAESEIARQWSEQISVVYILGMPMLQEYAFIHHPSKSLILTDLAFNFEHIDSLWSKIAIKLYGAYGRFTPSWLIKKVIKDKQAFSQSIQEVLKYDFDRIIVSHGKVVTNEGKKLFKQTFVENL